MKGSKRRLSVIAAASLSVLLLAPVFTGSAAAATTYTVQMGLGVPFGFSSRVLAPVVGKSPTITIHKGDTVNFRNGATLLPVGQGPLDWKADYATELDSPFGSFATDPDADLEVPIQTNAPIKAGPGFLGIPSQDCGGDAGSQCVYDGSNSDPVAGVLYGGDREPYGGNMYVRIDANPGETIWAIQGFGALTVKSALRIRVVANNEAATDQNDIDAAKATYSTIEKDLAKALDAKLTRNSTKHKTKSGTVVWDAYAGYDTGTLALIKFYPAKLVIHKGDKVRWHFSQLQNEDHGVGFPFNYVTNKEGTGAGDFGLGGITPVCDPDGDGGDGPDTFDVDFDTFSCPAGTDLELDLRDILIEKSGDGKYPSGHENSGVRGSGVPVNPFSPNPDAPWDVKFTKKKLTGFRYACTVHGGFMDGRIVVKS